MSTETLTPLPETPAPTTPPAETPPAAPAARATPAPAAPAEPANQPAPSIRDHQGRFAPRHRAESHRASPEDVPRIRELTKKFRGAEETIAQLQARLEAFEKAQPKPAPAPLLPEPPKPYEPTTFDGKEPKFEDFANDPQYAADPYGAYMRALARHDRLKEAHEAQTASEKHRSDQEQTAYQRTMQARKHEIDTAYNDRLRSFVQATPDFHSKLQARANDPLPPVAMLAMKLADNGPELVYALLNQPILYDELVLLTDGKPVSEHTVATTQRWLRTRVQAATLPRVTGSAAPVNSHTPAPRPPNPVRTGAMKTADEPPAAPSSIAEHARYYGKR